MDSKLKFIAQFIENKLFLGGNIDGLLLDVVGDVLDLDVVGDVLDLDVVSTFVGDVLDLDVVVALAARIIPSLSYVIHSNKFVNERLK